VSRMDPVGRMTSLAAAPGRPGGRRPLTALLEPRSVAVVGASARPGSFGDTLVAQLLGGGFRGPVHLVNPRYQEVAGLPCLPSLADLPGPVDLAVLAVPNASLETQLQAAAAHGIPAAVIFASLVEGDPSGGHQAPPEPPQTMPGGQGAGRWPSGCGRSRPRPGWRSAAAMGWGSSTSSTA
jgi:predicted CoA-binding protein